jgi:hypothetical protein
LGPPASPANHVSDPDPVDETSRPARRGVMTGDRLVPAVLAFCAGFVDIVCFVGLAQTFAAFMTGTLITVASEIVAPTPAAPTKAVMFATFVPAVALWSVVVARLRRRGEERLVRRLLAGEAALLAAMTALGVLLAPLEAGRAGDDAGRGGGRLSDVAAERGDGAPARLPPRRRR